MTVWKRPQNLGNFLASFQKRSRIGSVVGNFMTGSPVPTQFANVLDLWFSLFSCLSLSLYHFTFPCYSCMSLVSNHSGTQLYGFFRFFRLRQVYDTPLALPYCLQQPNRAAVQMLEHHLAYSINREPIVSISSTENARTEKAIQASDFVVD